MTTKKIRYIIPVFFIIFLLSACSVGLTSSNYWKGREKEAKWVEKKYSLSSKENEQTIFKDTDTPVSPFLKNGKEKFKVGIVISGDYWEFFDNFKALIEGFSNIGWANKVNIPTSFSHCNELFSYLESKKYSDFVEFPSEYFINLEWGDNFQEFEKKYLKQKPDVDIIFAYGGKAAKSFYDLDTYSIPVLSDAITDCKEAGITVSVEDSGKDFFSNKIDLEIFRQQVRLFHDIVKFKKLGIIYGDDEYGRIYGAVKDVEVVANERCFEIVRNTNVKEYMDDDTTTLYLEALKDLVTKCDAIYIGASMAVTEYDIMPQIVQIIEDAKIPSFSLEGTVRVKDGVLFSLSSSGMIRSGIYMATKTSHILAGTKPRSLSQKYENAFSVAINLEAAKKIGFKLPLDLLVNSDDLYVASEDGYKKYSSENSFSNTKETLTPKKRDDNKKYKIAVVESGDYWEFTENFKGIINGLITNGWIKSSLDVSNAKSIKDIYKFFSRENYSEYIEFTPEYFANLEWGDKTERINKFFLKAKPDIDLIIGLGGVAGKILSNKSIYDIPVLLEGITAPVDSGIVKSSSDSGKNFLTCRVDATQFQRQIQLFKNFTDFKKLGIVYEDNEYGRLYSAVNDVELMALKMGFEIVKNTNVKEKVSPNTVDLYLKALKDVCSKSDAVYIGASTALTEYDIMPQVVKIIEDAKIPSFALEGAIRVKNGILLGVSSFESEKIGLYNAEKIASILYGEVPRLLKQEFVGVPSIALNLDMAEKIGLDLSLITIAAVDQIYGGEFR